MIYKKGLLLPDEPLRKSLVWTNKAILIFAIGEILILGLAGLLASTLYYSALENTAAAAIAFIGTAVIFKVFSFVFFSLASILIWPLDYLFKQWIIARAKSRIENLDSKITIVGIAGSYGKTTMKEVLLEVLGAKFNTAATPESVNTPVGIARWILQKFDESLQVAIVEMGEHYKGDIKDICDIAKPDIAVITGINEAHLERMKKMENVENTIFEIAGAAKPGALIVLNGDDRNVMENYKKFVWPDHKVEKFSYSNFLFSNFDLNILAWEVENEVLGKFKIHLLGEYTLGDVDCAGIIAKSLGASVKEIKQGIQKIRPVAHRLEPSITPGNILVIDDAYNGNSDSAREAIKVLARFKDRRKIYITPGLVETGSASHKVHMDIGRQLAGVADVVILIRNSVTEYIELGVRNNESPAPSGAGQAGMRQKPEIIWFKTAGEAHAALPEILKPNDVILFQNDWGDQYT